MSSRHDAVDGRSAPLSGDETARHDAGRRRIPFWVELPIIMLIAALALVLVRAFVMQVFYIPSPSMEWTLQCGDRVAVNRLAAGSVPNRGDVIVFRGWRSGDENPPPVSFWSWLGSSLAEGTPFLSGLNSSAEPELVKRVVALPGEEVQVVDSKAFVNGKAVDGDQVFIDGADATADFGPIKVPAGAYFVLGDHRNDSADSRRNSGQFVDADRVVGRVSARVWPPSRIGGLNGTQKPNRSGVSC